MFDWYDVWVVILLALLAVLLNIHRTGQCYEFWTGGPIRRVIYEILKRLLRFLDIL
jgi:hypothetical protein